MGVREWSIGIMLASWLAAAGSTQLYAQTTADTPAMKMEPTRQEITRDLYVIIAGIGEYSDPSIPDRPSAICDAQALERSFEAQAGRLYQHLHLSHLSEHDNSPDTFMTALATHLYAAGPEDFVIFYFAGHGLMARAAGRYHLMMRESSTRDLRSTTLRQDDLYDLLLRTPASGLILMDTYDLPAGLTLLDQVGPGGTELTPADPLTLDELGHKDFTENNRWQAISMGAVRHQFLEESDRCMSEVGVALTEVLSNHSVDTNPDGLLNSDEVFAWLSQHLEGTTRGQQRATLSGSLAGAPSPWILWSPRTTEVCNGVDDDGDGTQDNGFDIDNDSYFSESTCPGPVLMDCEDENPDIHPDQTDNSNLIDDDCDEHFDEDSGDTNANGLSDSFDRELRRHTLRVTLTVTGSTTLTVLGGIALYSAIQYSQSVAANPDQYVADDVPGLQARSWLGLAGLGGAAVGASVTFPLLNRRSDFAKLAPGFKVTSPSSSELVIDRRTPP